MKFLASFVEQVSINNGKLSLAGIINPFRGVCNKLTRYNNVPPGNNNGTLTAGGAVLRGHWYFSTSARHFSSNSFSNNPNITVVSSNNNNNNNNPGCCENKRRRRKKTTLIITRTCWGNISSGGGVRNFSTGPSFLLTASGGRQISITKKFSEDIKLRSPRAFMEHHGVEPGKYVNFLLGMTPTEEDPNVFRGNPLYIHPSRKIAFGGCLLGQALSAAVCSAPTGFIVHGIHNFFLNPGRQGSVDYHVENVRDGNTYCNRYVNAMQNGKNIINMQVSLKKEESDSFQHQSTMPNCKGPEELQSASKLMEGKLSEDIADELKKTLQERLPMDPVVEFRPVDPETMYRLKPLPPKRLTWVKILEKLDDDENFHRCATAFLSDYLIITTTLLPNDNSSQRFFLTSLDHSIWFHNKYRVDDWLLYETESSHAGGGIGFSTGRFWTQDGILAASVAQQGVVRSLL